MSDELAEDLAYARQAAQDLSHVDFGTSEYRETVARLLVAFQSLDRGGAFAAIGQEQVSDERTTYVSPEVYDKIVMDGPAEPNERTRRAARRLGEVIERH